MKILPNRDKHVHPDFPVFDSIPEVFHVELVGKGASVMLKASGHFLPFVRSKELCSRRVVIHNPERQNGHAEGYEAFENEDPSPAALPTDSVHLGDTTSQEAAKSTSCGGCGEEDSLACTLVAILVNQVKFRSV